MILPKATTTLLVQIVLSQFLLQQLDLVLYYLLKGSY